MRWGDAEKAVRAISLGLLENMGEEIEDQKAGIAFDGGIAVSSELDLFSFFASIPSIAILSRKAGEHGRILCYG